MPFCKRAGGFISRSMDGRVDSLLLYERKAPFIEGACGDHTAAPLGLHFAAIHVAVGGEKVMDVI